MFLHYENSLKLYQQKLISTKKIEVSLQLSGVEKPKFVSIYKIPFVNFAYNLYEQTCQIVIRLFSL